MGTDLVWVGVFVALVVSIVVAFVVLRLGRRWDVIDRPDDELKTHSGAPVPLGGVAVLLGLHAGLAAAGAFDPGLAIATVIVFSLGLADDLRGLSPKIRLVVTTLAGVVLVLTSDVVHAPLPMTLGVVLTVVLVNAINLFDGLDGLASTTVMLAAVAMGAFAALIGVDGGWILLVLPASLSGVLLLNWPPAKLYLGDNGAYVLGVTLAWAVLHASPDLASGLVGAAMVGVPLLDLAVTVTRRLRKGVPLFAGDRSHTYDLLAGRLSNTAAVVGVMAGVQVLWCGLLLAAVWLAGVTIAVMVAAALGVLVVALAWFSA